MRSAARTISAALVTIAAGCQIDKLVDAPPTGLVIATPAAVEVAAAAGSSAPHPMALALRSVHNDPTGWTARHTGTGRWLLLVDSAGTTPDSLHFTIDPTGLTGERYTDTLLLIPDDAAGGATRVPVTLTLEGCHASAITVGATVTDSLRASDCASAHHPGRAARRYRFSGDAHDSVTFRLTSPGLAVDLIVDTAATGDARPLAESTNCGALGGACLRYLDLPVAGNYFVEITTGSGVESGPFTLALTAPHAPGAADPLAQERSDSATAVAVGGAVPEPEFVVRGMLHDADLADTLRLEVEVEPVGSGFTGEATSQSAPTPGGGTAFVRITGLTDGMSYHWRSRTIDQTGRATTWQSFGGNPESAADLRVAVAADRLLFRQAPTTATAGTAITPAIEVDAVDRDGVTVPGFTGTITLALNGGPAGATLSGTRSVSAVAGVATFPGLSLDKAGTGYTLLASSTGMIGATSPVFAITPGAATRLAFTQQPSTSTPNAAITPAVMVTAFDGYGNVATSFTGAVTIALGHDGSLLQNAQLGGTRTRNAAAGVATFADLTIDQLGGGYTLVASGGGVGTVTSAGFDIAPLAGSPSAQRYDQQPTGASAGQTIAPAVVVAIVDGLGDPVTGYRDAVTVALTGGPPGAALGGTTRVVPSNGVARFTDLTVDRAGTGYHLVASTPSLPDLTSSSFTISDAPPTTGAVRVTATTGGSDLDVDGYTAAIGGTQQGIAVNGATLFTGLAPGSASVALNGAAANCTVSGSNPRSVTVVAGDTATVDFAISCAAVTPPTGDLTVVTHTTGTYADFDGYTVTVGSDARGITANSSATYSGLAAGPQSVSLTGIASNCTLAGSDPRTVTVVGGSTVTLTFEIDCQPPAQTTPTALRFVVQPPATQVVGGNFGVVVAAVDDQGNVATSYTGRVSLSLLGGLLGTSLSGTTAVNAVGGSATFTGLRLTGPCAGCQLQASTPSLAGATSDPFIVVVP